MWRLVMSDGRMWMDTQQARGHAGKINQGVGKVRALIDQITTMIANTYWEGRDKERFLADWHGQLKPQVAQVLQAMEDGAAELNRRADEQDALSQQGR
jgi:hypothetical protein